jgi:hypothetical protein
MGTMHVFAAPKALIRSEVTSPGDRTSALGCIELEEHHERESIRSGIVTSALGSVAIRASSDGVTVPDIVCT